MTKYLNKQLSGKYSEKHKYKYCDFNENYQMY